MRRQTAFPRSEDSDQSLSDEDIDDGLDQLSYEEDCTEKFHSLYPHGKMTLSTFSDYYHSEVRESCIDKNGPVQSQLKEEHLSDSCDESISDEDNLVATESSLAYQCGTSKPGENYNSSNRFEGSKTSQWNKILEESSVLDLQPNKPVSTRDKGKANLKFSIRSNLNQEGPTIQESKIKKENSCNEEKMKSANKVVHFLEDINEEEDVVPYKEGSHPSMAELLEGLQGKNCTPSFLNSNMKVRDGEEKKKILPNLGERTLENAEDPPEYMAGDTSSEEEEINQKKLSLLPREIDGQRPTMADLFQEAFNGSNDTGHAEFSRSNYYGRLLQVMQVEKERHAEFSRFSHALHSSSTKIDKSTGVTVQIMSRSLEGRLTVCHCLFQLPLEDDKKLFERFMDGEEKRERMVIFNSKICENVDLVVGNLIRIYPPWKEVSVKEENIILCTYFSNDAI